MRKRLLSIFLCAVLVLALLPAISVPASALDGSWNNNYDTSIFDNYDTETSFTISTPAQLAGLALRVNTGRNFAGKTIYLANDLDMNAHYWVPIGSDNPTGADYTFRGTFDGQGHTISNIYIGSSSAPDSNYDYVGLFGLTYGATILKLGVTGIAIYSGGKPYDMYTGGLIGYGKQTTVDRCYTSGTLSSSYKTTGYFGYLGGLIGHSENDTITNSYVRNMTLMNAADSFNVMIGGFIAETDGSGSVVNCYADVLIDLPGDNRDASFILWNDYSVANCFSNSGVPEGAHSITSSFCDENRGTFTNCFLMNGGYNTAVTTGEDTILFSDYRFLANRLNEYVADSGDSSLAAWVFDGNDGFYWEYTCSLSIFMNGVFAPDTDGPSVVGVSDSCAGYPWDYTLFDDPFVYGGRYTTDVTPAFAEGTATLSKDDGPALAFASGATISAEGKYTLIVTGNDSKTTTVHFLIDKTAPAVTEVSNDAVYNTTVTPCFDLVLGYASGTDYGGYATLSKDGGAATTFSSGTAISAEGSYVLKVYDFVYQTIYYTEYYTDSAISKNYSKANCNTVSFTIDKTAPTVEISSTAPSTTNEAIPVTVTFNESVTGFTADDITISSGSVSGFTAVSGSVYTFNVTPATDGTVTIDVAAGAAQDAAGNTNTAANQLSRTYDSIAPTVTGVTNGGSYNTDITPTFAEGTATLAINGGAASAYTSGTALSAEDSYVLRVTDVVGNCNTIGFTIDKIAPTLSAAGCTSVTLSGALLAVTSSENGTYHYVVYASAASAPDSSTVLAGAGGAASASVNSIFITGLSSSTNYMAYLVVTDAAGNASDISSITFTTDSYSYSGASGSASANTTIDTTTSGNTVTATINATSASESDGTAAANVTEAQIISAIFAAMEAPASRNRDTKTVVKIDVDSGSATSVSASIKQNAFSALAGSDIDAMMVTTSMGTVTFDSTALDAINESASGDVTITIAKADTSSLTAEQKAAIGDRPVYDLTVSSGTTTISDFGGGTATVSIPYTLAEGEAPNNVVIYYISDSGELVMMPNCVYDPETGMVTFTTTHFSTYAVGYNDVSFTDVSNSAWYVKYVNYLAARGIIKGTGNGKFSPDAEITRAQFVTILANLSGDNLSGYTSSSFSDVNSTDWYFAAIQWAYENGVAAGSDGKFNPDANITRQDIAVMILRYAEKVAGYTLPQTTGAVTFADSADIASYAVDAVAAMQRAGIISGNSSGSFAPTANATRAQAAKMVALLLQGMLGS